MAGPVVIQLRSWQQFVDVEATTEYESPSVMSFLFRGHARADWELVPSLVRTLRQTGVTIAQALAVENEAILRFQQLAHLYLPSRMVHDYDALLDWLIVMQHYHAPTRILDWTRSMFVAPYFAVEREPYEDGAIWVVRPFDFTKYQRETYSKYLYPSSAAAQRALLLDANAPPWLLLPRPRTFSDRMAAQQMGITVATQILADHGALLAEAFPDPAAARNGFLKLIVPRELKPEFAMRLRNMNITAAALFPGIDGLGRSVAEFVSAETHYLVRQREREAAR